ncbi:MAG: tRNA (adenosine(37)-N6)-threonylcarbamoyltransferase complex dimerization subunit type 1 TsaB [Pseudomonadota bacterium]
MKLLAIETATEACSASLLINGVMSNRYEVAPRRHTQLILSMCEALIAEAEIVLSQLDAVAFGCGPGSFTGVRIAAGVVQGIAFAWDLPVLPVSTLATLAQEVIEVEKKPKVLAAIDARMSEVYWGYYRCDTQGLASLDGTEGVGRPADLPLRSGSWFGAGSGWQAYSEVLEQKLGKALIGNDETLLPKAQFVVSLASAMYERGETVTAERALPVYLRDNIAKKPSRS